MKLPNELYVTVESSGEDEFLQAVADAELFAEIGHTVTATLYRKVCTVRIRSSVDVIRPKGV